MRTALPDSEAVAQLLAFMRSVPLLWSQSELAAMHASGATHVEYRGSGDFPLTFDLEVLEHEIRSPDGYFQIMVSVSDSVRAKEIPGSSWQPLSWCFLLSNSGEFEVPSQEEVYNHYFGNVV